MASVVDVVNTALSMIGDAAEVTSIDPADGSAQADHAARFYPTARDETLQRHTWRFATKRRSLSELSENPVDHWAYAYALPTDCIQPVAVLLPESTDDTKTQDFEVESSDDGTDILYCNVEDAVLKYVWRQTDTTRWSPLFTRAVARRLAADLSGPIMRDTKESVAHLKVYEEEDLPRAIAADASGRQTSVFKNFTPSHIEARGS